MARSTPTDDEKEEDKQLTALALAGDPMILLDNVPEGMPVGTAKCHAHRGRNGLRERLSA